MWIAAWALLAQSHVRWVDGRCVSMAIVLGWAEGWKWLQDLALSALPFSEPASKGRRLRRGRRASTAHQVSTPHLLRLGMCTYYLRVCVLYMCSMDGPSTLEQSFTATGPWPSCFEAEARGVQVHGGSSQGGRAPPIDLVKCMRPHIVYLQYKRYRDALGLLFHRAHSLSRASGGLTTTVLIRRKGNLRPRARDRPWDSHGHGRTHSWSQALCLPKATRDRTCTYSK